MCNSKHVYTVDVVNMRVFNACFSFALTIQHAFKLINILYLKI